MVLVVSLLTAIGAASSANDHKLARSRIADVDGMDGVQFERLLEAVFRARGFAVKRTPISRDFGADLIVQMRDVRAVVQAKRYSRNVGIKAVQEVVAAREMYGCENAIVITNRDYTHASRQLAVANRVELWDRKHLMQALLSLAPTAGRQEERMRTLSHWAFLVVGVSFLLCLRELG